MIVHGISETELKLEARPDWPEVAADHELLTTFAHAVM